MIPLSIIVEGKNIREAKINGLKMLGAREEDVDIEVLEKEEAGILWKQGRPAKVKVSLKEDPLVLAKVFLQKIFSILELPVTITIEHSELEDVVMIAGEELGFLIGRNGVNLTELQLLVSYFVARHVKDASPFSVDINGYLKRKKQRSIDLAKEAARKVRLTGREVALKKMSAYERRLVHLTLKSHPDVMTFSVGEGEDRQLIVKLKD